MRLIITTLFLALLIILSCKKDDDIIGSSNQGALTFSVDTLLYDTVFTTAIINGFILMQIMPNILNLLFIVQI